MHSNKPGCCVHCSGDICNACTSRLNREPADLAHTAAFLVAVIIEGEHALGPDQVHALLCVREGVLYSDAIMLLHSVKKLVCLRIQPTSVQTAEKGAYLCQTE